MIYLPLLYGRPEVLEGDSSFEVCKVTPFRVQGDSRWVVNALSL